MKTKYAISQFGDTQASGIKELAKALGITVFAIYQWGENVPELRAYQIKEILQARDKLMELGNAQ